MKDRTDRHLTGPSRAAGHYIIAALAAVCLFAAIPARADSADAGHLNIVIEDNRLLMNLTAPHRDILGFKAPVKTEKQRKALASAKAQLAAPGNLFTFGGGTQCTAGFSNVDYGVSGKNAQKGQTGGTAPAEKKQAEDTKPGGPQFEAVYEFTCADLEQLKSISTSYFKLFPNAKSLIVRFIGGLVQNRSVLTPKDPEIVF